MRDGWGRGYGRVFQLTDTDYLSSRARALTAQRRRSPRRGDSCPRWQVPPTQRLNRLPRRVGRRPPFCGAAGRLDGPAHARRSRAAVGRLVAVDLQNVCAVGNADPGEIELGVNVRFGRCDPDLCWKRPVVVVLLKGCPAQLLEHLETTFSGP